MYFLLKPVREHYSNGLMWVRKGKPITDINKARKKLAKTENGMVVDEHNVMVLENIYQNTPTLHPVGNIGSPALS